MIMYEIDKKDSEKKEARKKRMSTYQAVLIKVRKEKKYVGR